MVISLCVPLNIAPLVRESGREYLTCQDYFIQILYTCSLYEILDYLCFSFIVISLVKHQDFIIPHQLIISRHPTIGIRVLLVFTCFDSRKDPNGYIS